MRKCTMGNGIDILLYIFYIHIINLKLFDYYFFFLFLIASRVMKYLS